MHGHMNVKNMCLHCNSCYANAHSVTLYLHCPILFHTNQSGDTVGLRLCFPASALLLLLKITHRLGVFYNI
jgi:hypothetical protein